MVIQREPNLFMNRVNGDYSQFPFNMTLDDADDDGLVGGVMHWEGMGFIWKTIFGLIEFNHE